MPRKTRYSLEPEDIRRGETLRALREAHALRVGELSIAMGISSAYLSNIEAARKRLSPQLAKRAAEVLGCRPIALLRPDEFGEELAS